MCACEPGYLCPRCELTPADPRYEEQDDRPEEFFAKESDSG
jgi:hypothetical protein